MGGQSLADMFNQISVMIPSRYPIILFLANYYSNMPVKRIADFEGKNDPEVEQFSQSGSSSGTSVMRATPDAGDIQAIIANARAQSLGNVERNICNITLYRNGFVVGDGQFRSLQDSGNSDFLEALKNGEVPQEMEEEARSQFGPEVKEIGVNLVNKSNEDFEQEPKFVAFTSDGHSMGSSTVSSTFENTRPAEYTPNDSRGPSGTIRLILSDNSQHRVSVNRLYFHPFIVINFNVDSTTVLELYQHVMFISGLSTFDILGGFPPKALTEPSVSVKEAGLIGATVRQKI